MSTRRSVAALLSVAILLSALPWEAAALGQIGDDTVDAVPLTGSPAEGHTDDELPGRGSEPVDGCACLCGLCAVSTPATIHAVQLSTIVPAGRPAPEFTPPGDPHVSSARKGLFRPPRQG